MTDRYTKFVLTIIALCLLYLCFAVPSAVPALQAASHPTTDRLDVNIVALDGYDVNLTGLPVRVTNPGN